jgi:hypothetical protein
MRSVVQVHLAPRPTSTTTTDGEPSPLTGPRRSPLEPTTCRTARNAFHKWFDDYETAETAGLHANNQWNDADNGHGSVGALIRGDVLNAAINAYNADLQAAKTLQAKADQDLAAFNTALTRCDPLSMPRGCQDEFAQYKAGHRQPCGPSPSPCRHRGRDRSHAAAGNTAESDCIQRGGRRPQCGSGAVRRCGERMEHHVAARAECRDHRM